jgi:hypothetical protein
VKIYRYALFILMALPLALHGAHAACLGLSGTDIVPRHPSIAAEYASAPWVFIGRTAASRDVPSPDDPGFYDWTIYKVEVVKVFKGKPPRYVQLLSENTSARFPMDPGKEYLVFVSHSPMVEKAGKEKLPREYVDNCGNSGAIEEAGATIRVVEGLSGAG